MLRYRGSKDPIENLKKARVLLTSFGLHWILYISFILMVMHLLILTFHGTLFKYIKRNTLFK